MNIKIDIDITPEEMRKAMGLPDLEPFQQQILDDVRERINAGVEGYDPLKMVEPYMKNGMAGMEVFQNMFTAGFSGSGKKTDPES